MTGWPVLWEHSVAMYVLLRCPVLVFNAFFLQDVPWRGCSPGRFGNAHGLCGCPLYACCLWLGSSVQCTPCCWQHGRLRQQLVLGILPRAPSQHLCYPVCLCSLEHMLALILHNALVSTDCCISTCTRTALQLGFGPQQVCGIATHGILFFYPTLLWCLMQVYPIFSFSWAVF